MSANVSVMGGVQDSMGGIRESVAKFSKNNAEVAEALLNISGVGTADGKPVHKDDPRPPYVGQEFPMMLYHADGRTQEVQHAGEVAEQKGFGFRVQPYPPVRVHINDPKTEKLELETKLKQQAAINASQADIIAQMSERLQALEVAKNQEEIAEKKRAK